MNLLRQLGLGPRGLPSALCEVSERGVRPAPWRRLVPLSDVDRFEVELRERDLPGENSQWGGDDGPEEQLVLLTRSGRTIRIGTTRMESLGNVALGLNNELARYGAGPAVDDEAEPEDGAVA